MSTDWIQSKQPSTSSALDDSEIDALLAALTPEEIEQLENEVDPDDSDLPPSERCATQTTKEPTGPYDKKKLLDWLETKAKAEPDWEEPKAYKKEKRGKVFVPKEEPKPVTLKDVMGDDMNDLPVETEYDDVLGDATEEELVDLAAALGFHSMLNQDQYNASMENRHVSGGFAGMAKAEKYEPVPDLPPNSTDVEASIEHLLANESMLTTLNLNNIRNMSHEKMCRVFDALRENTRLTHLYMSNTCMREKTAKHLAEVLRVNRTITHINLDSNFIGSAGILAVLQSLLTNGTVLELTVQNQRPSVLGVKSEMEITKLIEANSTLEKFGLQFESLNPRIRVRDHLQKNYDRRRMSRQNK